jgi:hypothetical protein
MRFFIHFVCLFCALTVSTLAAEIMKVKGKQALVKSEYELTVGKNYPIFDQSGAKKSEVKILGKNKNGLYLVSDLNGEPGLGWTLGIAKPHEKSSETIRASRSTDHFGILGSYNINKMSVKFKLSGVEKSTDMNGSGLGLLGYMSRPVLDHFQLLGMAGLEQFQTSETKSSPDCGGGTTATCDAKILYASAYGSLRYLAVNAYTKTWLSFGAGYLFAINKSSTVLDSSQISGNYVLNFSIGSDIRLEGKHVLPIILEYDIFPNTADVSANFIALRLGWSLN